MGAVISFIQAIALGYAARSAQDVNLVNRDASTITDAIAEAASSITEAVSLIAMSSSGISSSVYEASSNLRDIAASISSLPPSFAGPTPTVHGPAPLVPLPHLPSSKALTTNAEARKLKASIFLRENFAPLPPVFQSFSKSVQDILPDDHEVKFRVEMQDALETVLHAYYCGIAGTEAEAGNGAEADKKLDTSVQYIQTTLEYQQNASLKMKMAISLGSTLIFITILAIAHFLQYPMKVVHEVFTLMKFWTVLAMVIGSLGSVNKRVLGEGTPRASKSSLLQEAVLLIVKGETFWIELGTGALLSLLS